MSLSRRRSLWVAAQPGGFFTDPSANGAGYTAIPAAEIGDIAGAKAPIRTDVQIGDNLPGPFVPGADGGSFTFSVYLEGLPAAAGNGSAATATDYLSILLLHLFGASSMTATTGRSVSSATGSSVTLTSAMTGLVAGMNVPVFEAGIPASGTRTQWRNMTGGTTTTPTFGVDWTSNPTAAAVGYGAMHYRYQIATGDPLAFVLRDSDLADHTLLGCWLTSCEISMAPNAPVKASFTVEYDARVIESVGATKSALPAQAAPANPAPLGLASPVLLGTSAIGTASVTINMGYTAAADADVGAVNGRQGFQRVSMEPTVRIEPLRSAALENLKRDATVSPILVQLGRGVLASSKLNTLAFSLGGGVVTEASWADSNGRTRLGVTVSAARVSTGAYCCLSRA